MYCKCVFMYCVSVCACIYAMAVYMLATDLACLQLTLCTKKYSLSKLMCQRIFPSAYYYIQQSHHVSSRYHGNPSFCYINQNMLLKNSKILRNSRFLFSVYICSIRRTFPCKLKILRSFKFLSSVYISQINILLANSKYEEVLSFCPVFT